MWAEGKDQHRSLGGSYSGSLRGYAVSPLLILFFPQLYWDSTLILTISVYLTSRSSSRLLPLHPSPAINTVVNSWTGIGLWEECSYSTTLWPGRVKWVILHHCEPLGDPGCLGSGNWGILGMEEDSGDIQLWGKVSAYRRKQCFPTWLCKRISPGFFFFF